MGRRGGGWTRQGRNIQLIDLKLEDLAVSAEMLKVKLVYITSLSLWFLLCSYTRVCMHHETLRRALQFFLIFIEGMAMGQFHSKLCSYFYASLRTGKWDKSTVSSAVISTLH